MLTLNRVNTIYTTRVAKVMAVGLDVNVGVKVCVGVNVCVNVNVGVKVGVAVGRETIATACGFPANAIGVNAMFVAMSMTEKVPSAAPVPLLATYAETPSGVIASIAAT